MAKNCRAPKQCNNCGKTGHFSKECIAPKKKRMFVCNQDKEENQKEDKPQDKTKDKQKHYRQT